MSNSAKILLVKNYSEGRKPHTFRRKNANGKNDTRPVEWTDERILSELEQMLDLVISDRRTIYNTGAGRKAQYEYVYIGQLYAVRGISKRLFSEWRSKYSTTPENKELIPIYQKISETIEALETIIESRNWQGGIHGDLNSTMVKLHLSHKYGVKEKVEVEETGLSQVLRDLFSRAEKL